MASSENQFLCPICLDMYTDPVTISCGHNFCKTCITHYWDNSNCWHCPLCKKAFETRPDVKTNTLFAYMAKILEKKKMVLQSPEPESGGVLCSFCSATKALKSCLMCQASYCQSHLNLHTDRKGHKLIDAVENLEERVCKKHERPLELFCKSDNTYVCQFCIESDHKTHTTVTLEEACEERRAELGKIKIQVGKMIEQRQQRVEEIRTSIKDSERNTEKEITDAVQVLTSAIRSFERCQAEIIKEARNGQEAVEKQAENIIRDLEQDISELQIRHSELKKLSHTEDQFHLLKTCPSLCILPSTKNLTEIELLGGLREDLVSKALSVIDKTLSKEQVKNKQQLLKHHAVDVTLDPDTAHPNLTLSDDGKQVRCGNIKQNLPNNPKRFYACCGVLAKKGFTSGKFYYEVELSGSPYGAVGLVQESVDRKSSASWHPEKGSWIVGVYAGAYKAYSDKDVVLSLTEKLHTLGVFVDYENREVSFYNAESGSSIYTFMNCDFNEKIYPYFSKFGTDRNPMIIHPVRMTRGSSSLSDAPGERPLQHLSHHRQPPSPMPRKNVPTKSETHGPTRNLTRAERLSRPTRKLN